MYIFYENMKPTSIIKFKWIITSVCSFLKTILDLFGGTIGRITTTLLNEISVTSPFSLVPLWILEFSILFLSFSWSHVKSQSGVSQEFSGFFIPQFVVLSNYTRFTMFLTDVSNLPCVTRPLDSKPIENFPISRFHPEGIL